jgi:hypothetical protein
MSGETQAGRIRGCKCPDNAAATGQTGQPASRCHWRLPVEKSEAPPRSPDGGASQTHRTNIARSGPIPWWKSPQSAEIPRKRLSRRLSEWPPSAVRRLEDRNHGQHWGAEDHHRGQVVASQARKRWPALVRTLVAEQGRIRGGFHRKDYCFSVSACFPAGPGAQR